MTDRTVNNLPAATHGEPVRCLFAIELSTKSWVIAFNTPLSEKISRRTLTGCKWKGLLELIEQVRARVSRETGRTALFGVPIVIDANQVFREALFLLVIKACKERLSRIGKFFVIPPHSAHARRPTRACTPCKRWRRPPRSAARLRRPQFFCAEAQGRHGILSRVPFSAQSEATLRRPSPISRRCRSTRPRL
jgi:hypothetical protein